eukprot:gene19440-23243_t
MSDIEIILFYKYVRVDQALLQELKRWQEDLGESLGLGGRVLLATEGINGTDKLVVVDVRNQYEYDVGHFKGAVSPGMRHTAQWQQFVGNNLDSGCALRGKKVLLYCTGGIRCEKASAYLKASGCEDVSQLSGGIHRYLEEFGEHGLFQGKNFVFDKRMAAASSGPGRATADDHTVSGSGLGAAPVESCLSSPALAGSGGEHEAEDEGKSQRVAAVGECSVCGRQWSEHRGDGFSMEELRTQQEALQIMLAEEEGKGK